MTKEYDDNHECDCGCQDDMDVIYLTLDDDTELECNVIGTFEVDDYEYIALVPVDDDQVLLYRYEEDEEGFDLINIEDDEEFEIVSEAFYTLFVEEDLDFYEDECFEDYDEDFEDEE
ncbi:MAG: DUF1292 domain-containing protein [Tissierellia bacterium]|nr:DUF1292 domain-containing protein [Tissierellia bacterium]